MLSDRDIRWAMDNDELGISWRDGCNPSESIDDDQFQPVSVDLRLGDIADPAERVDGWQGQAGEGFVLMPGVFALASTLEWVDFGPTLAGQVVGKSSWARRGLLVEAAGLVDPGFSGELTLELKNLTIETLWIPLHAKVCQLTVWRVSSPVQRMYGTFPLNSHYQGQTGPTPAR